MTTESTDPTTDGSAKLVGGVSGGLLACGIDFWILRLQAGPYDGWLLSFVLVLATTCAGWLLARSPRWRPLGLALAVTPLFLFSSTFLVLAAMGLALGS